MKFVRAVAVAFALGSFAAGAPALADGSFSSGASVNGGSTRVTVGFSGNGFRHNRRGRDTGFGGSNVAVGGPPGQADFARGRGRDRRDFRPRRRGGRGGGDFIAVDPRLGYSDWNYRHNRTALANGYFGHGSSSGRGGYDYDRGYPYDYYNPYPLEPGWDGYRDVDFEPEPPLRRMRCRVEMAVRVCGG